MNLVSLMLTFMYYISGPLKDGILVVHLSGTKCVFILRGTNFFVYFLFTITLYAVLNILINSVQCISFCAKKFDFAI